VSAVWGASVSDVWAVTSGGFGTGGAILHWNGAAWSVAHQRMEGSFSGVWGANANDVWVVGSGHEPAGDYASLILHWDGTAWTESYACTGSRFASGGFVTNLVDVWGVAGGSVWAVGSCYPPTDNVGLVTRGGQPQHLAPGLAPLLEHRSLGAVWASADTNVWVASSAAGPIQGIVPTILHFNGTSWTESSDPNALGIYDLGGSGPNDVWAVGVAGKRLHFNGTVWTSTP
jgi:hypothetical protein